MRRKAGSLIPIEVRILAAGLAFRGRGQPDFHGFLVAKEIQADSGARQLTAHGTLYKALDRMEKAGLLRSRWEDADAAANERRPRRRLYEVTPTGERALADAARAERALGAAGSRADRAGASQRGVLEGA